MPREKMNELFPPHVPNPIPSSVPNPEFAFTPPARSTVTSSAYTEGTAIMTRIRTAKSNLRIYCASFFLLALSIS